MSQNGRSDRPNRVLAVIALMTIFVPAPAAGQAASEWRYTQLGSLIGGAAGFGLIRVSAASCGIGCDNDLPPGAELLIAGIGAGVGALAGFAADRLRGDGDPAIAVGAGPVLTHMTMRSSQVEGAATAGGVVAVVRLSRFLSVHGEYIATRGLFTARPGSIDPDVLSNVVPATSRRAGRSRGIERTRATAVFSEMIGIHPRAWGRVRLELLGGIAVHANETFSYYDADVAGKYIVLNFAAPDLGAVLGGNAEIAVARHFAIVPMVRYYTRNNPGPSLSYAVGALYRF
jgi:hypothetical protein